ncbi:hypothetical protein [Mycobacterium sp.]|uniref:DUF7159 family protein n=1 Tax=Mycobacterium sp. TaxID=1785 RepID=UPI0025F8BA2E|nr:hypothetical protein [Mycobacterium sp.]
MAGGLVDTVLGVSMAPTAVRVVLVEGENADGATVDEDNFAVAANEEPATFSGPDQVVAAILGTREGASEAGYDLLSTGVTWTDQRAAAELRDALAARKVENVMLVSSFLAAAALAQSMGSATGYARNALLYVEPDTATLAVVNTSDGSIIDVHRQQLPDDDDQAVAALVDMVSTAEGLDLQPDGLLVVGSGVDIPLIKPALVDATSLPISVPEHPETALARGAALASANAPLFASSTAAQAYALDPGTGVVSHHVDTPGYLAVAEAAVPVADAGADALAYSAVDDDSAAIYTQLDHDAYVDDHEDFTTGMYPDFDRLEQEQQSRTPFLVAMGVLIIFVAGVMGLVISLAFSIRPSSNTRPGISHNVVAPARPLPAPLPAAPPAPEAAPVPAPAAVPAPVEAGVPAPAPPPVFAPAPAPPPVFAPPPPPPAVVPAPIPIPIAPILPGLLPGPGWGGPPDRGPGWGGPGGPGRGPDWGGPGRGPGWGGPGGPGRGPDWGGPKGGRGGPGRGGGGIPGIPGFGHGGGGGGWGHGGGGHGGRH